MILAEYLSKNCIESKRTLSEVKSQVKLCETTTKIKICIDRSLTGSVLKATIVALRKMREATIVALMALRVLLIQIRISC